MFKPNTGPSFKTFKPFNRSAPFKPLKTWFQSFQTFHRWSVSNQEIP